MAAVKGRWSGRWLPVLLLGLAFALRICRLGDANVWWDEALAVWAARKPWSAMTAWTAGDVHPPLFFWLLWPWQRLVGQTEFALRYLSLMGGVLLAAIAWASGRRLGGWLAGALALVLVGASRFTVWWSMELRMYVLAALAIATATYGTVRWLSRLEQPQAQPWSRALAATACGCLAALYSLYLAVFGVVWLALVSGWCLIRARMGRRWLAAWAGMLALLVAVSVPWLAYAVNRMPSWRLPGEEPGLAFVSQLWLTLLATGRSTHIDTLAAPTLVFWLAGLVALAAGLRSAVWRPRRAAGSDGVALTVRVPIPGAVVLLGGFLFLAPLVIWLATLPRSVFYSPHVEARYFVPFAAPTYVLLAWAVARLAHRCWLPGAAIGLCLLGPMLWQLPGHYRERRLQADPYAMMLAIWSQAQEGDVVLLVSGNRYPLFRYYYDRPWVQPWNRPRLADVGAGACQSARAVPPESVNRPPVVEFPSRGSETLAAHPWREQLMLLVQEHPRVWLVEFGRELQDPNREVEAWLNAHLPRVLSESFGADALHLYAAGGVPPRVTALSTAFPGISIAGPAQAARPVAVDLAQPLLVPAVGLASREARTGDRVPVTLFASGLTKDYLAMLELFPLELASEVPVARVIAKASLVLPPSTAEQDDQECYRLPLPLLVTDRIPGGRFRWSARLMTAEAARRSAAAIGGELTIAGNPPLLGVPCEPSTANGQVKVGPLVLHGAQLWPRTVRPGKSVIVDLCWYLPAELNAPSGSAAVFAHLLGPAATPAGDRLWAGQDGPPSSGPWPWDIGDGALPGQVFDRHLLPVPRSALTGVYQVEVGVYDVQSGERWPTSGPGVDSRARAAQLGEVVVP